MRPIYIILLISTTVISLYSQENWELVRNKEQIKVYVSSVPKSNYYAFKAEMTISSSPNDIIKVLKKVNNYPDWFAYTSSSKLINQTGNQLLFFMETNYPWPYSNESMNYVMKFTKTREGSQKITITGTEKNLNGKLALNKAEGYILLQAKGTSTKITYYFHSEPSQNIPSWLINPMIDEMPYQTFVALRKKLM